jgi:hypothetical protein
MSDLVAKICAIDHIPFLVKRAHAHKRRHCSRKCMAIAYRNRPFDPERLWKKVLKGGPDECWPWQGSCNIKGYGQISIEGRPRTVTRVIWKLLYQDIPPGIHLLHRCDNPPCCNPAHLFLGTPKDNTQDMMRKGRNRNKPKATALANSPT